MLHEMMANNLKYIYKVTDVASILHRDFVRAQKYKTEAETFGWSFVFQDFVSEEQKSKVTQKIEVQYQNVNCDLSRLNHVQTHPTVHVARNPQSKVAALPKYEDEVCRGAEISSFLFGICFKPPKHWTVFEKGAVHCRPVC